MISISLIKIDQTSFIGISFPKDQALIDKIKQIPGRKWSNSRKKWLIPNNNETWLSFKNAFKNHKIENPENPQIEHQNNSFKPKNTPLKRVRISLSRSNQNILYVWIKHDDSRSQELIKQLPGKRWNSYLFCWMVPNHWKSIHQLRYIFGDRCYLDFNPDLSTKKDVKPKIEQERQMPQTSPWPDEMAKMEQELILKRYSRHTVKTYLAFFKEFTIWLGKDRAPQDQDKESIRNFLYHWIKFKKASAIAQNQMINAVKFYFEKILKQEKTVYDLPRPKKAIQLPKIFSEQEIKLLLKAPKT